MVTRQQHIDGADFLRTHPGGGTEVDIPHAEFVAELRAEFEAHDVGNEKRRYHAQCRHTPLARRDIFLLDKTVVEIEIYAPQGKENKSDEPIGAAQFKKLAFLRFDDGEDEQQRGGGVVHNEVDYLYRREKERQRRHVEEGAAAEQTQPQAVHCQGGNEIDTPLPERNQILRHNHAHQRREQQKEQQADKSDDFTLLHPYPIALAYVVWLCCFAFCYYCFLAYPHFVSIIPTKSLFPYKSGRKGLQRYCFFST